MGSPLATEGINMRKVICRAIAAVATLAALGCLAKPASAASMNGLKFLQAQGSTTYAGASQQPDIPGSLTLTGLIEFNGNGGAKAVAITLNYNSPNDVFGAVLCELRTAGDVKDEFEQATGVGTFTVMLSKNDACILTQSGDPFVPDSPLHFYDRPITFDLYHGPGNARIASTASAILDGNSNVVNIVNVVGSIVSAH
jgi:hypothetical protein